MKTGGEISSIEEAVPNWGGGENVGDILMAGGGSEQKETKEIEWEVRAMIVKYLESLLIITRYT